MVAECEADLIWLRTREGMQVAKAKGRLRGKAAEAEAKTRPSTSWSCTTSAQSRAPGSERVSRSSFVTAPGSERVSRSSVTRRCRPLDRRRAPAEDLAGPGSCRQAVVDVDAVAADPERVQPVALGGEILLLC